MGTLTFLRTTPTFRTPIVACSTKWRTMPCAFVGIKKNSASIPWKNLSTVACRSTTCLIRIFQRSGAIQFPNPPAIFRKRLSKFLRSPTSINTYNPPEYLDSQKKKIEATRVQDEKFPSRPQRDVLGFLLQHAPLKPWQQDCLEVVRNEASTTCRRGKLKS